MGGGFSGGRPCQVVRVTVVDSAERGSPGKIMGVLSKGEEKRD